MSYELEHRVHQYYNNAKVAYNFSNVSLFSFYGNKKNDFNIKPYFII